MSIGYKATETERRKEGRARLLRTMCLFEASFVSLPPMHPRWVESIKGYALEGTLGQLRDALKELSAATS